MESFREEDRSGSDQLVDSIAHSELFTPIEDAPMDHNVLQIRSSKALRKEPTPSNNDLNRQESKEMNKNPIEMEGKVGKEETE